MGIIINHEIRIPVEQSVFNGIRTRVFFFVAHVSIMKGVLKHLKMMSPTVDGSEKTLLLSIILVG